MIREAWAADLRWSDSSQTNKTDWSIRREVIEYKDGDLVLEGLYARPEGEGLPERLPGVILVHTAVGPQEGVVVFVSAVVVVVVTVVVAVAVIDAVVVALAVPLAVDDVSTPSRYVLPLRASSTAGTFCAGLSPLIH